MIRELGQDLLKKANAKSGWQLSFTQQYMIWLHFEKKFLYPTLASGCKLTDVVMTELIGTVQPPSFVNIKSRSRYVATLMMFWEETCNCQYFEVLATEEDGFCVISRTRNFKRLQKSLFAYNVQVDQRHHYCLKAVGYNSLYQLPNGSNYILYGPLQFANHSCSSDLSIILDEHDMFHVIHEYEGVKNSNELLQSGSEVLLKYAIKEELWFECHCFSCK